MAGLDVIREIERSFREPRQKRADEAYPDLASVTGRERAVVWLAHQCSNPQRPVLRSFGVNAEEIKRWAIDSLGLKHERGDIFKAPMGWVPPLNKVVSGIALRPWES